MRIKYLSYKQAVVALLNFKYLVGQPFEKGNAAAGKVKHVLIAPYNRILQWQFLYLVYNGTNPEDAIAICKDGKYTVLVLSEFYHPTVEKFRPKELHVFLDDFCELIALNDNSKT